MTGVNKDAQLTHLLGKLRLLRKERPKMDAKAATSMWRRESTTVLPATLILAHVYRRVRWARRNISEVKREST
jgi:hypothetical protein